MQTEIPPTVSREMVRAAIQGASRDEIKAGFGVTAGAVEAMAGMEPSPFLGAPPSGRRRTDQSEYISCIREAAEWNGDRPLSASTYDKWAELNDRPRALQIVHTFGRWTAACEAADVQHGSRKRDLDTYPQAWSDEDIEEVLAAFAGWCVRLNRTPTTKNYGLFRSTHDGPSPTTLRIRVPDVRTRAREMVQSALLAHYEGILAVGDA
jgi:hypothetical protein